MKRRTRKRRKRKELYGEKGKCDKDIACQRKKIEKVLYESRKKMGLGGWEVEGEGAR